MRVGRTREQRWAIGAARAVVAAGLVALLPASGWAQSSSEWPDLGTSSESPAEVEARRVGGSDLRRQIPDLDTRPWPPPPTLTFGLSEYFPFQVIGFGATFAVYPSSRLRVEATYSLGWEIAPGEVTFGNYGELLVGVAPISAPSERSVDLMPDEDVSWWRRKHPRPPPTVAAWLPSHHAVFIEAGAITGLIVFEKCLADCSPDPSAGTYSPEPVQLVYPVGGLRYVYFVDTTSKSAHHINRKVLVEFFAHAIVRPIYDPGWTFWAEQSVTRVPVGARFGVLFPLCLSNCFSLGLTGGYLPAPGVPLVDVSFRKSL